MSKDVTYFPFVRTGLSSAVAAADNAAAHAFVELTTRATVNGAVGDEVKLRLAGPGEIRGLDRRCVGLTDPTPGAMGVPPNLFATIELRPADLPWMFTPLGASGDHLRPWLCLVVTELAETGEPVVTASRSLPRLHVAHPDLVLPDPQEAWAWAYVAAPGDTDTDGLKSALAAHSPGVVARLVCPRRLAPETQYVAALVPVFEGGALAGVGNDASLPDKLKDAWSVAAGAAEVDLPVYHWWTFMTGVGGDFRSLALRLRARTLPTGAGSRTMDIASPGAGLLPLPAGAKTRTLGLEGALQPDGFVPTPWETVEQDAFQARIADRINTANTAAAGLVLQGVIFDR